MFKGLWQKFHQWAIFQGRCASQEGYITLRSLFALKQKRFSFHSCYMSISGRQGSPVYCSHTGCRLIELQSLFLKMPITSLDRKKKLWRAWHWQLDIGHEVTQVISVHSTMNRTSHVAFCVIGIGKLDVGKAHKWLPGKANLSRNP